MSDSVILSNFRTGEIQHAICDHCGHVVRVVVPRHRSSETLLGWTTPLAILIWLAIIWKFSNFLSSPKIEIPPPIEASFVELSEGEPTPQAKNPEVQPKNIPKQEKRIPIPDLPRQITVTPPPPAGATPDQQASVPKDLMSYVNAARDHRQVAESAAAQENAEAKARERGPTADEVRTANIMRNLQPGTSGVFQINHINDNSATFTFRGWTTDRNNVRPEVIEVTAGPDGNIQLATVRRMISLIRKYYKGDFNWDSDRIGQVITLSARQEDNTGLEEFMMKEFFGASAHNTYPQ